MVERRMCRVHCKGEPMIKNTYVSAWTQNFPEQSNFMGNEGRLLEKSRGHPALLHTFFQPTLTVSYMPREDTGISPPPPLVITE